MLSLLFDVKYLMIVVKQTIYSLVGTMCTTFFNNQ
jgi:hypothetical protein